MRGVNAYEQQVTRQEQQPIADLTFIEKVQTLVRRKLAQHKALPPFMQMSIQHWTAHSTIRKLTKPYPELGDNMVETVASVIETTLLDVAKEVGNKHVQNVRRARDLGTLTAEQIEENNIHGLPLPVRPRSLGDSEQEPAYMVDLTKSFIHLSMPRMTEKLEAKLNLKITKRALFEKQLEKPLPYQGFQHVQLRRNPATVKARMILKKQTFTDPAELFGVDRSTLDLPGREYHLPQRSIY
jgi:hypothetical protein